MKKDQEIQKRSQIDPKEVWDLTPMYKDFSDWETRFLSLPTEEELEKKIDLDFKGKLSSSPNLIASCFDYKDDLERLCYNLYVYANLRRCEDASLARATEACGKIENKMTSLFAKFSFFEPELLMLQDILSWAHEEPLKKYQFRIENIVRFAPHTLSEKEEAILAKLSVPLNVFHDIHGKWNDVDLKFNPVKDSKDKDHLVSNSRYSLNMQSYDRILRENTFNSYYSEISKWKNTIAANYYGNMVSASITSKLKNFSGSLESSLFADHISPSLYDGLIQCVRQNLPHLHRSMKLRKQVLNIPKVSPFDRYVSLYQAPQEIHISWEEGLDLVLNAIAPLGEEYQNIARKGLTDGRWIDRAENEGKRSGAFSWGTFDSPPYMLMTWKGTLSDVYTLAHELGHSMHSYYSHKCQPYHYSSYTIFVAEVASTLNEALLTQYILNKKSGTDIAKQVISESIENFEGTLLRQVLFAAFEREASLIADCGETFTSEKLEEIYFRLNQEWYGEEHAALPNFIRYEWMRIPHFYNPFYVYKYATSYAASLALASNLEKHHQETQRKIFSLLCAGGSKPPIDILKDAGVDFSSVAPVEEAFKSYVKNIERAESVFSAIT